MKLVMHLYETNLGPKENRNMGWNDEETKMVLYLMGIQLCFEYVIMPCVGTTKVQVWTLLKYNRRSITIYW